MRIVYMGTPDFAVAPLETLVKDGHEIAAVFSQPDKPKGRGYTLTPPPVKECALKLGLPVYQPASLKDSEIIETLKGINPDLIAVVAYGKILPEEIINLPRFGCINVHGSLLPKYRGAAPIQQAVLDGETVTGVTTMYMDKGLDTGDMLLKEEVQIGEDETASELHDRLSIIGASLLGKTVKMLENGQITPEKQDDSQSTYAKMLDKSLCKIDWGKTNSEVHNKVRGLNSWPIAVSTFKGRQVKIYKTKKTSGSGEPGEIISLSPFVIACGSGAVEVLELQLPGKKCITGDEFVRGHRPEKGDMFE